MTYRGLQNGGPQKICLWTATSLAFETTQGIPWPHHVFFTRWFFQLDVMHLPDCKGVAAIAFGSLLCYMVTLPSLGPRVADRLSRINRERLKWIRAHPGEIHLPVIKESNLRKDGWGDLHGPAFKSAITRHAAGFSNICPISS